LETIKEAAAEVGATGQSKEITLTFSEAEVTQQAAKRLAQVEIPQDIPLEIESVHIDFQPDNVLTEAGSIIYDKIKVTIKVKAEVGINEGKPDVEITSISFGFIPLPGPLKDKIADFISQKTDALQNLIEAELESGGTVELEFKIIKIEESKMTITLLVKPKTA